MEPFYISLFIDKSPSMKVELTKQTLKKYNFHLLFESQTNFPAETIIVNIVLYHIVLYSKVGYGIVLYCIVSY